MRKTVIGVMGPGDEASEINKKDAYELGREIAKNGWVLLNGGRNVGVMDAVSKGAHDAHGLVIGILPFNDGADASEGVDIQIITGMAGGRNIINVRSSDVVVACGIGAGTASEIAHALKIKKPTILLGTGEKAEAFFKEIGPKIVITAKNVNETIKLIKKIIKSLSGIYF